MGWKKGDVVMKAEPYAHVLANKHRDTRCSYCLQRKEDLKRCTACSLLRYCGRQCQKQDWALHKVECKCLQRVAPSTPTDSVLLMLRLVIRYMAGEHRQTAAGDPGLRTFDGLMSHTENVKKDPSRCDAFAKVCHTLTLLAGEELQLPPMAELLGIFGRMVVNTFTISDEELQDIGSGLYISPATIDHSCEPNAVVTFQGTSLYIRAVDDVPNGHIKKVWEDVFISYVDQMAPSWERQQQLQEQYYFQCACPKCCNSQLDQLMTSGIAEEGDSRDGESANSTMETLSQSCQTVVDKVESLKTSEEAGSVDKILQLCKDCLAKVDGRLSPYNVYRVRVLDRAFDAAIRVGLWEEALGYILQTLQAYRKLYNAYSPNLALQLMRAGKLQLFLGHVEDAHANLVQAENILKVTHGRDSSVYRQLGELLHQCVSELSGQQGFDSPALMDR